MKKQYRNYAYNNKKYNQRAFENNVRRAAELGPGSYLFFIIGISLGVVFLIINLFSTNGTANGELPLLILFLYGDWIMIRAYISEKNELQEKRKREDNNTNEKRQ